MEGVFLSTWLNIGEGEVSGAGMWCWRGSALQTGQEGWQMGNTRSGRVCLNTSLAPCTSHEFCLTHYLTAKRNKTFESGELLILWVNPADSWRCISMPLLSCIVPDWKRAAYPHRSGNAVLGWRLQNKIAQRSY